MDSLQPRQRWAGSGSGSADAGYGRQSNSDSAYDSDSDNDNDNDSPQYAPLQFTCDLDHNQFACKTISLSFTGGCKPYSLSAFWFTDGNYSDATWVELNEQTWDNAFQWNIIAPVSSQLLFTITDAIGASITSEDAVNVLSNGLGRAQDTWCQYIYNSAPVPTADVDGSHKYAWNASSHDGDNDETSSSASTASLSTTQSGTATSSYASKVSATASLDTNATDLNDKSTTISKAIHDANQAKTIEGVLAALLGVSLIALFALLFLFLRLRKRYRSARSQLALHQSAQGGHRQGGAGGLQGVMSEKPGEAVSQYSPQGGLLTPRAGGRNGDHLRNPFDDASAIVSGHQGGGGARSPLLGSVLGEGGRQSVTSLVSAVPSHGARSTAADSAISTEFYHTYKASTIPPRDPNDPSSASGPFGGMMRSLFAPMSFFSSATPSPNPSTSTRSVSVTARSTGREGETSSLNTDYYGDRNSVTRPETTRSGDSSETIHDAVTRVSTRSGGTAYSTSDADTHSHLAPSSASRQSRQSSMTTSNGADVSSVAQHDDDDTYSDTDDAASFSNFSYIDTGRLGFSSSSEDVHADNRRGGSSEEGSTTVVEPPRNPFREPSPDESLNKRRSWNRPYAALDREFLDSTQSFDSK